MPAMLHQPALVEDSDIVAEPAAGEPMADEDRRFVHHDSLEILVNGGFS